MTVIAPVLLYISLAGTPVVVTPLDGDSLAGEIDAATPQSLTMTAEGERREIPASEILSVKVAKQGTPSSPIALRQEVILDDGSHIGFSSLAANRQSVSLTHDVLGELEFPHARTASVRFGEAVGPLKDAWLNLLDRERKQDLLVLRKDDILDHLEGVISSISDESIVFLLDGDEIEVPRDRVFGIIYLRKTTNGRKPICQVRLDGGDLVNTDEVTADAEQVSMKLSAGPTASVAWSSISELDYSQGKVVYLSSLEPRDVKYTPFFDITWEYARDRNFDGQKLQLGNTVFERGLCLHSKTEIVYRIGKDFRKFRATVGIDRGVSPLGNVLLRISGDGKILHEAEIRGEDQPVPLELDVSNVRDLEILVDFGGDLDIADHLNLADARVIK